MSASCGLAPTGEELVGAICAARRGLARALVQLAAVVPRVTWLQSYWPVQLVRHLAAV